MRVPLDNCVPWRLGRHMPGHDVDSVARLGWVDLDDGPLFDALAEMCDVFVSADKSLPCQQRIQGRAIAVVVLRAGSNRLESLLPPVPALLAALDRARPGEVREIAAPLIGD